MNNPNLFSVENDVWMTATVGFNCFKVNLSGAFPLTEGVSPPAAEGLRQIDSTGFYQVKVAVKEVRKLIFLQKLGFYVVDTNVTFSKPISSKIETESHPIAQGITIGLAMPKDRTDVETIAKDTLSNSRFHLDPQFPKPIASELKKKWVGNFFEGLRGQQMIVAREGDRVVGFILLIVSHSRLIIDLIAVDPKFQSKGIGAHMLNFAQTRGICHDIASGTFAVGTQISNIGSIKFYLRHGFNIEQCQYVLHKHQGLV